MPRLPAYGNVAGQRMQPLSVTITVRGEGKKPYTMRVPMCSRVGYQVSRQYREIHTYQQVSPLHIPDRLEHLEFNVDYPVSVDVTVDDDPDVERDRFRAALEVIRGIETNPDAPQFAPGLAMAALERGWWSRA